MITADAAAAGGEINVVRHKKRQHVRMNVRRMAADIGVQLAIEGIDIHCADLDGAERVRDHFALRGLDGYLQRPFRHRDLQQDVVVGLVLHIGLPEICALIRIDVLRIADIDPTLDVVHIVKHRRFQHVGDDFIPVRVCVPLRIKRHVAVGGSVDHFHRDKDNVDGCCRVCAVRISTHHYVIDRVIESVFEAAIPLGEICGRLDRRIVARCIVWNDCEHRLGPVPLVCGICGRGHREGYDHGRREQG